MRILTAQRLRHTALCVLAYLQRVLENSAEATWPIVGVLESRRSKEQMRYLSPVQYICLALVSLSAPGVEAIQPIQKKSLEPYIEQVTARESVINCGDYAVSTPHSHEALLKSLACAAESAKQHKPSRLVVYVQGEDSSLAHGVLSDATGHVFFFSYDSAPCGGPMCTERFEKKVCWVSDVQVTANPSQSSRLSTRQLSELRSVSGTREFAQLRSERAARGLRLRVVRGQ